MNHRLHTPVPFQGRAFFWSLLSARQYESRNFLMKNSSFLPAWQGIPHCCAAKGLCNRPLGTFAPLRREKQNAPAGFCRQRGLMSSFVIS